MPYMTNGKRDYKKENKKYSSKPKQKKNRAARNAARAKLMKEGKVHKGDGKDVAHKKALIKGGSNKRSNLSVQSRKKNRSVSKTSKNRMKGNG